ncbi:hypothetical protein GCM10010376_26610 [Streptomyces violaceusniger]
MSLQTGAMSSRTGSGEAIVVGAGPNGLAVAVTLALSGFRVTVLEAADTIGGGTRSGELGVPGVVFDHCSSAHVVGAGSPFLRSLDLKPYGSGHNAARSALRALGRPAPGGPDALRTALAAPGPENQRLGQNPRLG